MTDSVILTPTSGGQGRPEGTGVFLGGRYSRSEVISFGGMTEEAALGVRSSKRIMAQPNADATQMDRAKQRAQARDNYSGTDLVHEFTLASLPNDVVVARASKLGVSLGKSPSQIESSVQLLKDLDLERTIFMLKRKEAIIDIEKDDNGSLVLNEPNKLAVDLIDEEAKDATDHKDPPVKLARTRARNKKIVGEVSAVRRSARFKKNN